MTVIARIQSDLMDLLIIVLTVVCVIEARGQTQFLFFKTFGMSSKLRVCSNYLIFRAWVLFLKQTNISDLFQIVYGVDDQR